MRHVTCSAGRVLTAAELDAMTSQERQAAFDVSVVRDLVSLPPEFLARVRQDAETAIARHETRARMAGMATLPARRDRPA